MKKERIEGFGSIHRGEYDSIHVDGVGKLRGQVKAGVVNIDGLFKSKGKLTADEVNVDGMARVFRNMKTRKLHIDGLLKMRHADLSAESITCDGMLTSTGEVSADDIRIDGICSIAKMYGDNITINYKDTNTDRKDNEKLLKMAKSFGRLFFGRRISLDSCIVDQLECTRLTANGLKAIAVKAGSVKLEADCRIKYLYCDGDMLVAPDCKIGRIISKGQIIKYSKGENEAMANSMVTKILDMYKEGKLSAEEAEKMLFGSNAMQETGTGHDLQLPWNDDGKLRIVAFIGRKLLKRGDAQSRSIEVKYDGEALNVESYGNLTCGDVQGSASAGGGMNCRDIGGNVSCGGGMSCGNVEGNVSCGGGMECGDIRGKVSAGGGVRIMR